MGAAKGKGEAKPGQAKAKMRGRQGQKRRLQGGEDGADSYTRPQLVGCVRALAEANLWPARPTRAIAMRTLHMRGPRPRLNKDKGHPLRLFPRRDEARWTADATKSGGGVGRGGGAGRLQLHHSYLARAGASGVGSISVIYLVWPTRSRAYGL